MQKKLLLISVILLFSVLTGTETFGQLPQVQRKPPRRNNTTTPPPKKRTASRSIPPTLGTDENRQKSLEYETVTVNNISFRMVRVEGGTFMMGGTSEQGFSYNWEKAHQVTLSTYSIGETEVTQELWEAVMGNNPSKFKGSKHPVEEVSWEDCQQFINKLNQLTGRSFRLPTEAEWEYAARGGNRSYGYKYAGSNNIDDVAWYLKNCSQPSDVALKLPNELGLYDMSGNVWEWCYDFWSKKYGLESQTNPRGPSSGSWHVSRGGHWDEGNCEEALRVSNRGFAKSGMRCCVSTGLRLAL